MSSREEIEALNLIKFAMKHYPDSTYIGRPHIVKVKRPSPLNRDLVAPANLTIALPDAAAAKFQGLNGNQDLLLMVHVRKEVVERFNSPLVVPGQGN